MATVHAPGLVLVAIGPEAGNRMGILRRLPVGALEREQPGPGPKNLVVGAPVTEVRSSDDLGTRFDGP